MNNIEKLTPEVWFEEGRVRKEINKNDDGIRIPYHYKGTFLWVPSPSVADLVLRQLRDAVDKLPNSLHVLFSLS